MRLAIGEAKSISKEVAIGLSKWSLWKVLTNFRRCCNVNVGFQVLLSLRYLFQNTR